MDGMTELLAGIGDSTQASWHPLPQEQWEEEITAQIYKLIPPDLQIRVQLHWNKEDRELGYAMGSAMLATRQGDVKAMLPLIVKDGAVAPFDIIIAGNKFMPVTEDRIRQIFDTTDAADQLVNPRDIREYNYDDIGDEIRPHTPGMSVFSSDRSSFMESREAADIDRMRQLLAGDTDLLSKLANAGLVETVRERLEPSDLMKTASEEVDLFKPNASRDSVTGSRPFPKTTTWEKTGSDNFKILVSREDQFGPQVINVSDGELRVHLKDNVPGTEKDSWLDRVYGEETATLSELDKRLEDQLPASDEDGGKDRSVLLYRTEWRKPEAGEDYGPCYAMTTAGQRLRGVLYPDVVGFDGRKVRTKIFDGGYSALQASIAVERLDGTSRTEEPGADDAMPSVGDTGFFSHTSGDKVVALMPVTITSVLTRPRSYTLVDKDEKPLIVGHNDRDPATREANVMVIRVRAFDGKSIEIVVSPEIKGIVDTTPKWMKRDKQLRYAMSGEFAWHRLGEFREFMETPKQIESMEKLDKTASIGARARLVAANGRFELQAPWVKEAQEKLKGGLITPGGSTGSWAGRGFGPVAGTAQSRPVVAAQMWNHRNSDGGQWASELASMTREAKETGHLPTVLGGAPTIKEQLSSQGARVLKNGEIAAMKAKDFVRDIAGRIKESSIRLDDLSPGEAHHLLSSWGLHTKVASRVLGIAERRGACTILGMENPLEKFAGGGIVQPGGSTSGAPKFDADSRALSKHLVDQARFGPGKLDRIDGYLEAAESTPHGAKWKAQAEKKASAQAPPAAIRIISMIKRAAASTLLPVLTYRTVLLEKYAAPDDTVENVLDLNFLNPQNLAYFVGTLPKLRGIQDSLGRLLIATRLGLPHVEEETVRSTLRQLDSIIEGLSSLAYTDDGE
jgi:hypothetical protein